MDTDFGEQLAHFSLINVGLIVLSAVALLISALLAYWLIHVDSSREFLVCLVPIVVLTLPLLLMAFSNISVDAYEDGLVQRKLWGVNRVRWQDIAKIQIGREIIKVEKSDTPFIVIPIGTFIIYSLPGPRKPSWNYRSSFVIRSDDGEELVLTAGARLFELASLINQYTFAHIYGRMKDNLAHGRANRLHERIRYSKAGIEGTLIKGTRSRRREEPFSLKWNQFSGYRIVEGRLSLYAEGKRLVTVPVEEVVNLHVFQRLIKDIKTLRELNERNARR
jgi:hypothetical protein